VGSPARSQAGPAGGGRLRRRRRRRKRFSGTAAMTAKAASVITETEICSEENHP
jgi:hypothetical protein